MEFLKELLQKEAIKRTIVFTFLGIFIYLLRDMFNLFLLTFLFTYSVYSLQRFLKRKLGKIVPINDVILTVVLYVALIVSIILIFYKYIPVIINQSINIIYQIKQFKMDPEGNPILRYTMIAFKGINISEYTGDGVNFLFQFAGNIGKISINVFFALVLSMFFMLEKDKVKQFMERFKSSKMGGFYTYLSFFGRNFLNSFAKVIQAQILIALINSILSVVALSFMGFPQLLGLGGMIFFLSLIPVAGTMISLIPLSIIAFNIGGVIKIIYVLILIAVLHGIESYFLNPKFMSAKTELPVFFIFMILIISEHFIGVWGLLIGIPLFMFLLDLLDVNVKETK